MSHVRNLFHPLDRRELPKLAVATAVEGVNPISHIATVASPALPSFPAEEAHLSPELRLAYYTDPRSTAADRFRFLRMRLKELWRTGKLKKVLITSALPHDGKSTVILNLATALAERGKHSVLVIEADLHHPSITENLRVGLSTGLSECLVDESTAPLSAIRRIEPLGWNFMSAGEPRKNPMELVQSPAFGHVMQKLTPYFDWILVDSPPLIPLTDSLSLQQHVDASLLVVRAGVTPREAVEQSVELLGKKNILGMVLNGVEQRNQTHYQYNEYTGHSQED